MKREEFDALVREIGRGADLDGDEPWEYFPDTQSQTRMEL